MTASVPRPSNLTRGYTISLVSAAVLSTTAIFIRYLTENYHVPALVLAFFRDLIAGATLFIILAMIRPALLRLNRAYIGYLLIYGLMMAIFNSMWTLSVAMNGAAVSTVLAYCSAAFTALLGWWFLKEQLHWVKLLAVAVCLGGCVLVANALDPQAWRLHLAGFVVGVLAGLMWAIYSLMGRSASQRGLNPWTTLFYTFSVAAFLLFFFNLLSGGHIPGAATRPADLLWLGKSWAGWGILLLLAAGPTLAGFGLYNVALSMLPSSVVNLIATSEPAFTAITAYLVLGERLSSIQLIGSVLILGGVVFLRIYEGRWGRGVQEAATPLETIQ
jgi:drug/metabolite transporter (DMT)-like permease